MSVTQIVDKGQSPRRRRFPDLRVPPNLFAIVLGIAGLAEAWHAAAADALVWLAIKKPPASAGYAIAVIALPSVAVDCHGLHGGFLS